MANLFRSLAGFFAALLLTSCAGNFANETPNAAAVSNPATTRVASASHASIGTLYVLSSGNNKVFSVAVFADRGASFVRTINIGAFSDGFTVDGSGHLYIGYPRSQGDPGGPGDLSIYQNRGAHIVRILDQPHAFGNLAADEEGNLFTDCAAYRVCEYENAKQHISRRLSLHKFGGTIGPVAIDASGDFAVGSLYGPVLVFAPGATTPYWKISTGIDGLSALAFDSAGNLYVANAGANGADPGSVTVYSPSATSPSLTITSGIVQPSALTLDSAGNLYALNGCIAGPSGCQQPPSVTVYSPGSNSPSRTITHGIFGGYSLIVDRAGYLYVANFRNQSPSSPGNVVVYGPGSSTPTRTIAKNIDNPVNLGISP